MNKVAAILLGLSICLVGWNYENAYGQGVCMFPGSNPAPLPDGIGVRPTSNTMGLYYLANGKKLGVPNPATKDCLGLTGELMIVDDFYLNGIPTGPVASCGDKVAIPSQASSLGWSTGTLGTHEDNHFDSARHLESWAWTESDGKVFGISQLTSDSITQGTCGGVVVGVTGTSGNLIQEYTPPSGCVNSKTSGQANTRTVCWGPEQLDQSLLQQSRGMTMKIYEGSKPPLEAGKSTVDEFKKFLGL